MSVALLRDLAASPRPTGSDAIAAARARVARELESLGFEVRERPFEFSAFPGRFATPLFGAATVSLVGVAGHWGSRGQRWIPMLVLVLGGAVLWLAGRWMARRGVLTMPLLRERGVNLEAKRPGADPTLWLCAHLDTKSQPIPTLIRMASITLVSIGFAATLLLAIAAALGSTAHLFWWASTALVTLVGAVPVVMSVVGTNSPGALDNASGVAAVVMAAGEAGARDFGVLVTDAEELGLAGARAWSVERGPGGIVLNCDGVDDEGENVVMSAGAPHSVILGAAERASAQAGIPCRQRGMPFGLLTDAVAFNDARIWSVTFSRGSFASLARVHSRNDDLAHLHGTGIAKVAALMSTTVRNLGGAGTWKS